MPEGSYGIFNKLSIFIEQITYIYRYIKYKTRMLITAKENKAYFFFIINKQLINICLN